MKTKLLLLIIIVFSFISCNNKKQTTTELADSLLWKISGNGLKSSSYLFGTYHNEGGLTVFNSIPAFDSLFNTTTQFICEAEPTNFEYFPKKELKSDGFLKQWPNADSTYQNMMTKAQKLILDSAISRNKALRPLIETNIRPMDIIALIVTPKSIERKVMRYRATSPCKLNHTLFSKAKSRRMDIVHLETSKEFEQINDSLNSLLPQLSYKAEADYLICYIQHFEQIDSLQYDIERKTYDAYLAQNINQLAKVDYKKQYTEAELSVIGNDDFIDTYKKMMIDERNQRWANKIPALIKGESSFIAVKASHLGGQNGLIYLLRKQGYKVTPVK